MIIAWGDEYLTGIPDVDEQHRAIFDQLEALSMALLRGESSDNAHHFLRDLVEMFHFHFNYEEVLMYEEGCQLEAVWRHSEDHQVFIQQLQSACDELQTVEEMGAFNRYAYFWLRFHVLTIDKPACKQILLMRSGMSQSDAVKQTDKMILDVASYLLNGLNKTYSDLYESQLYTISQNSYLMDAQQKLKQYNNELEDRVKERTTELEEANRRLQIDYEQLKKLNEKLKTAQDQLLQSEKMAAIGQLSAGVAHEINNPVGYVNSNLGTLKGYVHSLLELIHTYEQTATELPISMQNAINVKKELVEYDYIRDDIIDLLSESTDGLDRVKHIIQDLKDFARAGESIWIETDIHKGIDSTLNVVWNELKYKAIVHKEYGDIPYVRCVPEQINQVIMNILVNAAHAIDDSGEIRIHTALAGENVLIQISDTGRGMPDSVQKRIFEPFFTTKPVGQGTGLGLALAYSIIQKHKGQVTVQSEVGKGTTFSILIPISGAGERDGEVME